MKNLIFCLLFVCHSAGANWINEGELWTGNGLTDGLWVTANATILIDWAQTRDVADKPDQFIERNSSLGAHPNTGEVNSYFAKYLVAVNGVYYFMPDNWKPFFSVVYIVPRYDAIEHNHEIGVKFEF